MANNNEIDKDGAPLQKIAENAASNLTGILSLKPMAKYLSGARCTLRMNGKIVGFAFGISWKISTDATEINTIDDYMPYELAPSRITVTGSITGFRIPGSGPGNLMLQSDVLTFMHQRYVEIEVRDSQTDNLIFLTKKALVTNRTENIRTDALADMTMDFKAIGFADERAPQRPDVDGAPDIAGINPIKRLIDRF